MNRSKEWLVPLTGAAFVVLGVVSIIIGGQPTSADKPADEIVSFYIDNKDAIQVAAAFGLAAGALLVFFGAYLRGVLRAGDGAGEMLSLVSFVGLVMVAFGLAIDGMISFAAAEAAGDDAPQAIQSLQALWDNDFLPIALGVLAFLWATGLAIVRSGVLPKWIGWVMIALGVLGVTPLGFVSAVGSAVLVLVISILLSVRARSAAGQVRSATATA